MAELQKMMGGNMPNLGNMAIDLEVWGYQG